MATLQTALISAATATVVTLMIEYLAKPRLEVRKDRIVETARTWRDLRSQVAAVFSAPAFSYKTSSTIPWSQLADHLRELSNLLETCERTALRLLPRGLGPLPSVLTLYRELLVNAADTVAALGDEHRAEDDEAIASVLVALDQDLKPVQQVIWRNTRTSHISFRVWWRMVRGVDDGNLCVHDANEALQKLGDRLRH